jgi:hypothetical protein
VADVHKCIKIADAAAVAADHIFICARSFLKGGLGKRSQAVLAIGSYSQQLRAIHNSLQVFHEKDILLPDSSKSPTISYSTCRTAQCSRHAGKG